MMTLILAIVIPVVTMVIGVYVGGATYRYVRTEFRTDDPNE